MALFQSIANEFEAIQWDGSEAATVGIIALLEEDFDVLVTYDGDGHPRTFIGFGLEASTWNFFDFRIAINGYAGTGPEDNQIVIPRDGYIFVDNGNIVILEEVAFEALYEPVV